MSHDDYLGFYYYLGLLFHVQQRDGELVAALSGAPEGYEIELEPLGGAHYRMGSGPVTGLPFSFERDASGQVFAIQAGNIQVSRVSPEQAARLPVTGRFPAPPVTYTPEKTAAFSALLDRALGSNGSWLEYELPFPRHEFIQYVTARQAVIFHGSNNQDIETFAPLRTSTELYDHSGRGNRMAVYGTHEGLWAMFFAVVDRPRLRGSIRNGVAYFQNRQGQPLTLFNFSINQEQLSERPFCEGALYFLPRSAFERLELMPGALSNEWACSQAIQPLAKLLVSPEDWPFLDVVEGHDDSMLIRVGEIGQAIREAATRAELEGDSRAAWLPAGAIPAADLDYYLEKQAILMPAIRFERNEAGGQIKLVQANLPPAVKAQLAKSYAELLQQES